MILGPREAYNAGVEDGEASTAKFRRFLAIVIPIAAIGYIGSTIVDFDKRWPKGIAIGGAVSDAGLISAGDNKTAGLKFTSYENRGRCVRFLSREQDQLAGVGIRQGADYDARVSMIPKIGRDICDASPIAFAIFYDIVSIDNVAKLDCAPGDFIARGRRCKMPAADPIAALSPPVTAARTTPVEVPTNDLDPPPAVPYRPFGANPPPAVSGLDGDDVDMSAFYPPIAIRFEQQGVVRVRVTYSDKHGSISCTVLESSGSSALDRQTCRLVGNNRLFTRPVTEARKRSNADIRNGEATIEQRVDWRLPE